MTPTVRTVVFDNEAVQAVLDPTHRKHRRVMAYVDVVTERKVRRPGSARLVVPTSVRVEAGWSRSAPRAAGINRLRIDDHELDRPSADAAATIRSSLGLSVTDAHLGVVLRETPGPHAVLTSDVGDVGRLIAHLAVPATVVAI